MRIIITISRRRFSMQDITFRTPTGVLGIDPRNHSTMCCASETYLLSVIGKHRHYRHNMHFLLHLATHPHTSENTSTLMRNFVLPLVFTICESVLKAAQHGRIVRTISFVAFARGRLQRMRVYAKAMASPIFSAWNVSSCRRAVLYLRRDCIA